MTRRAAPRLRWLQALTTLCAITLAAAACSDGDEPGAPLTPPGAGGGGVGAAGSGASSGTNQSGSGAGFATGVGAGGASSGSAAGGGDNCGALPVILRDFPESHIDFQDDNPGHVPDLVQGTLQDGKPVYAHGDQKMGGIENASSFAEWYTDIDGTNQRFEIELTLDPTGNPDEYEYDDSFFFPLDGMGFGNSGQDANGMERNFHFTTEIHTQFEYQPGQVFTFRGDDDLWLFIDGELAIDLGGVHGAMERTVELDDLGLTAGETYPMDIFHAERHTSASNFRMTTTIDCFQPPDVPR